jgi:hypothetical protein
MLPWSIWDFSVVALVSLLLGSSPLAAQSQRIQTQPYGFDDIYLGMSLGEFRTKHAAPRGDQSGPSTSPLPGQATCGAKTRVPQKSDMETRGIEPCYYKQTYLGVPLGITTMFLDGKLAVIEVEPPYDTPSCFEPLPPDAANSAKYFHSALCKQYPPLLLALTDQLGPATRINSTNENLKNFDVRRWENDSSVAEFQDHMCGPWDGTDGGWASAIMEALEGTYCKRGDNLSARQPVLLYLHKDLSRTMATRLAKPQIS